MRNMRDHIKNDTFDDFVKKFMYELYPNKDYPTWVTNSLASVNINLNQS